MKVVVVERLHGIVTVNHVPVFYRQERKNWCCVQLEMFARWAPCHSRKLCFVGPEKDFDSLPRKVLLCAMRKKEIPEVLVRSMMSLCEGAKIWVRVDSELSEEFEVKVWMQQGSVTFSFWSDGRCLSHNFPLWAKWVAVCWWFNPDEWGNSEYHECAEKTEGGFWEQWYES